MIILQSETIHESDLIKNNIKYDNCEIMSSKDLQVCVMGSGNNPTFNHITNCEFYKYDKDELTIIENEVVMFMSDFPILKIVHDKIKFIHCTFKYLDSQLDFINQLSSVTLSPFIINCRYEKYQYTEVVNLCVTYK